MTFDSSTLVRQLQALERQIADAAHYHDALRAATASGDWHAARYATERAARHLHTMAITTGHLKADVVAEDGLGPALESLSELALRAARLVVLTELDTLRAIVHAPSAVAAIRPIEWGRFGGIGDLTTGVRSALEQGTASWCAVRGRAYVERRAYRAALHAAHAAMRQLGTASEFGRFLWEGRRRTNWPALQATCTRMSIALTHRIDVEPDRPLVAYESAGKCHGTCVVIHEGAARSADGNSRALETDRHSHLAEADWASIPAREGRLEAN